MAFVILLFILLVGVAGVFFGRDSRVDDVARRRRYQG
jgi:hypothetical protein